MATSSRLDGTGLTLRRSLGVRLAGACRRDLHVAPAEITAVRVATARDVSRGLFIRIVGTYLWPTIAMGWFIRRKMRKKWAWVWLLPNREIVVIETTRDRPSLVAVPRSWFEPECFNPPQA